MQLSTQISFSSSLSANPHSVNLSRIKIPSKWDKWFAAKTPTNVAYVQDMVHVAVKLKSRLLKPSVVLPLGKYVAGAHHLQLLQSTYGKDQHGLRERDLNSKDKQNFEAVLRITSQSVCWRNFPMLAFFVFLLVFFLFTSASLVFVFVSLFLHLSVTSCITLYKIINYGK